jgi:RNA polymerase sigma factor (sigma-70 family)
MKRAAPSEEHDRDQVFSLLTPYMDRLREFLRHQIAYFESAGELVPGELTTEEVLDAVLLRAAGELAQGHKEADIGSWLIQLANERLQVDIERLQAARDTMVHIEEDIPETSPEEAMVGEEFFEFYQPEEDLKLEDIFPDQDISTPEDMAAAKEELLRCVNAALAKMPREWRRALRLRHSQGLTEEELAEALEKAAPEVERILEYARAHLRQHLLQAGCTFIVKGSDTPARKRKSSKNG